MLKRDFLRKPTDPQLAGQERKKIQFDSPEEKRAVAATERKSQRVCMYVDSYIEYLIIHARVPICK